VRGIKKWLSVEGHEGGERGKGMQIEGERIRGKGGCGGSPHECRSEREE
jgi:hypothetical protein